jgi:hypothetical protein
VAGLPVPSRCHLRSFLGAADIGGVERPALVAGQRPNVDHVLPAPARRLPRRQRRPTSEQQLQPTTAVVEHAREDPSVGPRLHHRWQRPAAAIAWRPRLATASGRHGDRRDPAPPNPPCREGRRLGTPPTTRPCRDSSHRSRMNRRKRLFTGAAMAAEASPSAGGANHLHRARASGRHRRSTRWRPPSSRRTTTRRIYLGCTKPSWSSSWRRMSSS